MKGKLQDCLESVVPTGERAKAISSMNVLSKRSDRLDQQCERTATLLQLLRPAIVSHDSISAEHTPIEHCVGAVHWAAHLQVVEDVSADTSRDARPQKMIVQNKL